jgi:hypothetical protein
VPRTRRVGVVAALTATLLIFGAVGTASAAGRPQGNFSFTICLTTVFDENNNPLPAIQMTDTWSGVTVDEATLSWVRSDGGFVGFAGVEQFRPPVRAGSSTSAFTIQDDPTFDEAGGDILLGGREIAFTIIPEPAGGWGNTPACP